MKQIRSTHTLADAYLLRGVLQREGIAATIRNEHLPGGAGEVVAEEMPAVCVADGDVSRALFILPSTCATTMHPWRWPRWTPR